MRHLVLFAAGAVSLGAYLLTPQGQDLDKVEIKAIPVAGTVTMLEGSGGNIAVCAGEDGVLMVDDQFEPLAPKIREAIAKISDKPIKFVLNTHVHGDHTGGNAVFGKLGTIVAQENVRKRLASPSGRGRNAPPPKEALPVVTFDDSVVVHFNGEDIKLTHRPAGHTDGDSVIFFSKSNVVHMGDDFVTYGFPFVDASSGGTILGMIAALEKVATELPADVKVIPGHGPVSTLADVKEFIAFLKDCVGLVKAGIAAGKSIDDLKKEKVLGKYEKKSGFVTPDRFAEQIFNELKK